MKIAFEGRMEGKKTIRRPRMILLDWIFDKNQQVEISKYEGAGAR